MTLLFTANHDHMLRNVLAHKETSPSSFSFALNPTKKSYYLARTIAVYQRHQWNSFVLGRSMDIFEGSLECCRCFYREGKYVGVR